MIRQQIINALEEKLKSIKKVNGYNTDAGNNVYHWLVKPLTPTRLPAIVYRDQLASAIEGTIGFFKWRLRIDVAVFPEQKAKETPEHLRMLIEDVLKAIGQGAEERWGIDSANTYIVQDESEIEQYDKVEGAAVLTFMVEYHANKWRI